MVSYVLKSKKNKCTVLISSMHKYNVIDQNTGDKKKPEIITDYNQTKAAFDVVDQMRAKYNVAITSRRWLLTTFFFIGRSNLNAGPKIYLSHVRLKCRVKILSSDLSTMSKLISDRSEYLTLHR